jgi:hypothetical protein
MKTFFVQYEVRKIGAIGGFYHLSTKIQAENHENARQFFCDLYEDEYEFRNSVECYEVKE